VLVGSGTVVLQAGRVSLMTQVVPPRTVPERMPLGDVTPPGWRRWARPAAVVWALSYGSLRAFWAVTGAPSPPPADTDLVGFTGWWAVVLCAAAAVLVVALGRSRWSRSLAAAAWGVAIALAAASALLLLDIVNLLLPGIGVGVSPGALASRAACLAGAFLVGSNALTYQRHWHGACLACGSTPETVRLTQPPRWARLAAWAAVSGWLIRILAQVGVGFGELAGAVGSLLLFEAGFMLAGTVLPLALVHRWGRVFPRWVPFLAGRRVPRWLVLAPALGLGVGMTAYFGFTLVTVVVDTLTGAPPGDGSLPTWFFWVAVPGYLVWGLGLAVAGVAYRRLTRPVCRFCRR
jgi:hypothetical protein